MPPTWVGTLEIGGRLRIKNLATWRETLVGLEYYEESALVWRRRSAPGLHIYNTEELIDNGGEPELLVTLGGEVPLNVLGGADTTAHYFNSSTSDTDFTVCIDTDSQIPVATFPDWVVASKGSLLIVPPLVPDLATGILVRSPADTEAAIRPWSGIHIYGNYQFALHIDNIKDAEDPPGWTYSAGMRVRCENSQANCIVQGGVVEAYSEAPGSVAYGLHAYSYSDAIAIGLSAHAISDTLSYAGYFSSTWVTGLENIGVYINVDSWNYAAHIRFNGQRSGGQENPPLASEGSEGDLIASEKGLWYKATPPHNWRYVQWA